MTGHDDGLRAERLEVVGLVKGILSARPPAAPDTYGKYDAAFRFQSLLESGLWSIGMDEALGGGGAPLDLRLTALQELGTEWAAQAWACAEAHAAVELLGPDPRFAALAAQIANGSAAVCVVDRSTARLEFRNGLLSGELDRLNLVLDPAVAKPYVLMLDDDHTACLLPPDALENQVEVATTGLDGLQSWRASLRAFALDRDACVLHDAPVEAVRTRLHLSGAAIAAGLATEAADQAAEYARNRVQFGGPLTDIPMVRASLQQQAGDAKTSISEVVGASQGSAAEAAAALSGNCERAISVCAAALQSHGGYGYLAEFGVEALLRDAISLRAAAGAMEASHRAAMQFATSRPTAAVPLFAEEALTA